MLGKKKTQTSIPNQIFNIYSQLNGDKVIWMIIFTMSIISILVVYSSVSSLAYRHLYKFPEYYLMKHVIIVIIGLITMYIVSCVNYTHWIIISKIGLFFSAIMLLITWQFGLNINYASRWIRIPVINASFQPSDLAQIVLLIYTSYCISRNDYIYDNRRENVLFGWILGVCGLIALTNFSRAIILMLACFMVIFIAGRLDRRIIIKVSAVIVLVVVISLKFGQRGGTILSRLLSFSQNELPYQVYQSYTAIIRGGILGNGPGNSIQRNFLPHAYSDYIYSIIIEEYGLVCGVVIMIFYVTMTYRIIKNVRNRQYDDIFAKILAVALCSFITLESCVNMSVSVGLLPSTGIQLPFISMGGTSFIFTSIMYGIIFNIIQSKH